jgi:hypothetical protein
MTVLPAPATMATRTSSGCRAGRAILSTSTVGRMVTNPRVAAKTASDSAETGTNRAKVRMKSVSWALSSWREKRSASWGANHQARTPVSTPAAATGQSPAATPRRRSRTRPRAR